MRTPLAPALALGLLACSSPAPPAPTEYVQLRYQLTPGGGSGADPLVLPLSPGSVACGRQARELRVHAEQGGVLFDLTLRDAATMPSELQASTVTSGKVNVEIVVPAGGDLGGPVGFASADPGDLFVCRVRLLGPDPFAELRATFDCQSKAVDGRQLAVTEGTLRALPCP